MKINSSKVVIGILLSIVVWYFYAVFTLPYQTLSVTGSSLETFRVAPGAIVNVVHDANYHAKIDSCENFSIKTDNENVLEGIPQDLKGTSCSNSYYKIDDMQFNADSIEIVSGAPYVTLSAESPLGVKAGFPDEIVDHDLSKGAVITFWTWLLVMIVVFIPNWE